MDALTIMDEIQRMENEHPSNRLVKVLYVADNGENTCRECLDNDGKVFDIDDPGLPQLPIHPHCRCKYVLPTAPYGDVSEDVERHRIVKNLEAADGLDEEKAKSLAEQIIAARHENSQLREQKLFLLFNGRYLVSSDGKLLLPATAGAPTATEEVKSSVNLFGFADVVKKSRFDYSYERQAEEDIGALPQGLYTIRCEASGSLENGNYRKHLFSWNSWGNYHWRLVPSQYTDTRGRDRHSFTIHGGAEPGSAGCIDLTAGDAKFKEYLDSLNMTFINVYAQYPDREVVMEYETHTSPQIAPPAY
jgi:hypothetical protein